MPDTYSMTVGEALDGRKIAIISSGGHPQQPNSGTCHVVHVEVVDGWGSRKINDWFARQVIEKPWETRQ